MNAADRNRVIEFIEILALEIARGSKQRFATSESLVGGYA